MCLLQPSARYRAYVAGRQNGHRQFRSYEARQNALKECVNAGMCEWVSGNTQGYTELSSWCAVGLADNHRREIAE